MKSKLGAILATILAIALVLSGCTTPTPAAPAGSQAATATPAAEAKTFVVATDAAFPPMEFVDENKNIVGFDIDLLNAIAAEMGFAVEYKNTAWDGIFAGLESGDYDAIISAVTIREDRQAKYDFSEPYVNAGQAIVVTIDDDTVADEADLEGKVIGTQIGTTGAFAAQEISGATVKEYDTIDLAFMDLITGGVEVVIVDTPVAADFAMASQEYAGKLKIVGEPITEEFYGALVNKGQNADFVDMFNEGLAKLKASGKYDEIYAKWLGGDGAAPAASTSAVPPSPGVPIKVAILAPLSGDVKTFGESTRNGAMMVFEEAIAAGWEIEAVLADSKCDPQEAANAANKVVFEDGVNYIIGEVCSAASIPISEIAEANGVVQISPTSTNPTVTINEDGSTKDYVFRACFIDPFQGSVMAQTAVDLGASTAAVLYDVGNDYTKGLAEFFMATFTELGGSIVAEETYTKDDTDFSAILGKVAAADPDVLFLPDYYAKNNLIAAQALEKGITATFLGGDGWDSPDLDIDKFEGGYFSNHYSPEDPRPVLQSFVAAYEAKYGAVPDALATLAYDAARLLLQGISEAGVDDPAVVKDALAAITYDGVSGTITYDEQHNPIKNAAIIKIEGGVPKFFKSVAPAGAPSPATDENASVVPPAPGVPIKLAILAPLSGDVKTFGESTREGVLMAIEEAVAAGWEIETVQEDSKCDPQEAANAANKVVFEDEVHYIIGEVCSGASIPVSEIAEANSVVMVTGPSTSEVVTVNEDGSTKEYAFRACFIDSFQGTVMAQFAAEELNAKTAGVLYDVGNDYTKGLAAAFISTFTELGGTIVAEETYTKDDTDFSGILGKVAVAQPDVLFLPDYYAKNNLIAAQALEKGITATFIGCDGWDSPDLDIDKFEGGYFTNHYSPEDPRPILQQFVAAYKAKYGAVPESFAVLGYDATRLLLQAISEAGVDDPAVVKDALAAITYDGVSGTITYDEQHNPIKNAAIIKIEGGVPKFFKSVAP